MFYGVADRSRDQVTGTGTYDFSKLQYCVRFISDPVVGLEHDGAKNQRLRILSLPNTDS